MRTERSCLAALVAAFILGACAPRTECTLTGSYNVRVGAPIPTPSPWLADLPSCGDQMDLPLGTVVAFRTLGLDDDCVGTAAVSVPTVVETRVTSGRIISGYFGSPATEGFVFGRLPSGCEGGWTIQVTKVDGRVRVARAFTPEVAGSCPPIPLPVGLSRVDCIDFFDATFVE